MENKLFEGLLELFIVLKAGKMNYLKDFWIYLLCLIKAWKNKFNDFLTNLLRNVYSCHDRASRRAFFYADNPNYSLHSAPTIPIPKLWIKKRALSFIGLVLSKNSLILP